MAKKRTYPICMGRTRPCTNEIGRLMRGCRVERDLTQYEAAEIAGITQHVWSAIEHGSRPIRQQHVEGIARVLGRDAGSLEQYVPAERPLKPKTEVGKIMLARKNELGLSDEEFADRMGMSVQEAREFILKKRPGLTYASARKVTRALEWEFPRLASYVGIFRKAPRRRIGRNIRAWRIVRGLSQAQLAKRMKTYRQVVSAAERGTYPINEGSPILQKFATALGLDPRVLWAGPLPPPHTRLDT